MAEKKVMADAFVREMAAYVDEKTKKSLQKYEIKLNKTRE